MTYNQLDIRWLSDERECECCGFSEAQGAVVELDGVELLRLSPSAHCPDPVSYTEAFVYLSILNAMDFTVKERFDDW